ncbi:unnamed protein product [Allacma fusca]|uniref:Uncharacterized protein n=1 Tax=Allacma fusca TaxID=39272 RepID=A0A8J2NSG6_9HEXA|nr:unnamed protein product [Allacma fusca]
MGDAKTGEWDGFTQLKMSLKFACDILFIIIYTLFCYLREIVNIIVPKTPKSLKGEIILVTGGANGIGREICFDIANRETNLTIISWDLNKERNLELSEELKALGVKNAFEFTIDVTDRKQVVAGAKKIRDTIDLKQLHGDINIPISLAYPYFTQTGLIKDVHIKAKYGFTHSILTPQYVASNIVSGMLLDKEHIYIPKVFLWCQVLLACLPPAAIRMFVDTMEMNIELMGGQK